MEIYIKGTKNPMEMANRHFIAHSASCALFFSVSSLEAMPCRPSFFPLSFLLAPYPAFSTAVIISCTNAVPSTPMELVSRLTEQEVTPGTLDTAFSTWALQAAQLIPVTVYCSIFLSISARLFILDLLRLLSFSALCISSLRMPH